MAMVILNAAVLLPSLPVLCTKNGDIIESILAI